MWDSYKADPLKATARAKHGKTVRWHVAGSTPIPGNWQDFLRVYRSQQEGTILFFQRHLFSHLDWTSS